MFELSYVRFLGFSDLTIKLFIVDFGFGSVFCLCLF